MYNINILKSLNYKHCERKFKYLDILINSYTTRLESVILRILLNLEYKYLSIREHENLLDKNSIMYKIFNFVENLKNFSWENFYKLILKKNNKRKHKQKTNPILFVLNFMKSIYNIKKNINLYIKGFINNNFLEQYFKSNSNKRSKVLEYIGNEWVEKEKVISIKFKKYFGSKLLSFYQHILEKYIKYNRPSNFRQIEKYKKLSLLSRRRYISVLNYIKGNYRRNVIYQLALRYLGKGQTLKFARKAINKSYRSYRIFLFTFNLKPEGLWKITRKNRKFKNGGTLISHISYYQFNIAILMILANFCKSKDEVSKHIRDLTIQVNGRVICNYDQTFKPFDIVHFIPKINNIRKDNFLKDLMTEESNNFIKKINSKFFEYSFKIFCFIILPELFTYFKLTPPHFTSNSGRFTITKK